MVVYNWDDLDSFSQSLFFSKGTALSVGSFDGLHLGHRFLLNTLVQTAKEKDLVTGLITFLRPLPSVKHSDDYTGDISTFNQRLTLFESLGIDFVIAVNFNDTFASLKGTDFLSILVQKCNMKFLAEGIDFRCGYKGATDTQSIRYWAQNNNIECTFVDPVYYTEADGTQERVSSSYIRSMIQKGFFSTVNTLLSRPYELDLQQKENIQIMPPDGIYRTQGNIDGDDEFIRLEIENGKIKNIPKDRSLKFVRFF